VLALLTEYAMTEVRRRRKKKLLGQGRPGKYQPMRKIEILMKRRKKGWVLRIREVAR